MNQLLFITQYPESGALEELRLRNVVMVIDRVVFFSLFQSYVWIYANRDVLPFPISMKELAKLGSYNP